MRFLAPKVIYKNPIRNISPWLWCGNVQSLQSDKLFTWSIALYVVSLGYAPFICNCRQRHFRALLGFPVLIIPIMYPAVLHDPLCLAFAKMPPSRCYVKFKHLLFRWWLFYCHAPESQCTFLKWLVMSTYYIHLQRWEVKEHVCQST